MKIFVKRYRKRDWIVVKLIGRGGVVVYDYDVILSFANEDREYVDEIAEKSLGKGLPPNVCITSLL